MENKINDPDCPLCKLVFKRLIITKLYYENDDLIIVDCTTCKTPMLVLKTHGLDSRTIITPNKAWLIFQRTVKKVGFHPDDWALDMQMRTIHDHWHAHVRPKGEKSE